jgi:tetratricopeptide (TPR) repeat protein
MSQPILARAPSAAYQLRKFAVRNRTLVGGILATLIVLIAGAAVATAFGFREAAQRRAAEQARNDLEAVVEFQSGMLNDMDPEAVGRRLLADLKQRVGETGRSRGWPEGRIRAVETGFTEAVASINSTSLALRLIDEEILGRAARTAGERFQDRPRIYARLRDAIGETYGSLGMFRQAEEQLEEALNVRRRTSGDGSPETLLSMKHLSFLYLKQGRFDQARTAAEPGLVLHRRVLGEGHRESLAMAHNLALIYASLDRYAEAEPLSGETLARQRQVLGERHPDTLNSMDLLAVLSRDQGRLDAAEQQLKAALEARKSAQGVEHESTLQTLNNLAALYAMRGRVAEAAQLFQESLAVMKRKLGQEHPSTLAMMHNLAVSYSKLRRYSEAEALQLETLAHRRRVLGAEHPATLTTMNNLAIVYYDSGRRAEAERLDREILGMRRRTLGEDHTDTLVSMNNLAVLLRDAGRYGEAEPLFRDALERRRRVSGLAHPSTEQVRTNLIDMYRAQGRAADAAALMAEKLEAARMNAGREDAVSEVLNDAAWQLLTAEPAHLRDQAKALEFARRACAKEEAQRGPNLWNYLDTLALALQRNGDTAAAVEAEKRAIASLPPDRPERAGLVRQLAEFEARLAGGKSKGRNLPLQGGPPRK